MPFRFSASSRGQRLVLDEAALHRDWRIFTTLTFLFSLGFAVYNGVFQNFLRDRLQAGPIQLGGLESLREIPGFVTAITAGTLASVAESRAAGLGLLLSAIGIGIAGEMGSYAPLVAITVFWSVGFHIWTAMQPAITLALAKGREGGRHLGRMSGVGAAATLTGLGLALVITHVLRGAGMPLANVYRACFYVAGTSIGIAALLCMRLSAHAESRGRVPFRMRREYGLYYLLTFLEGCRRQIFAIFAQFALILVYHVQIEYMLGIMLVNQFLIAFTSPAIGRLVDKRGERGPLTFYSIGLIVVFLGYASVHSRNALIGLFIIDNVLFSFGVGFTTYLHRIVRPGELTACLSMGVTMNHIASVTVPIVGALLWIKTKHYEVPFWVGVAIATLSLFATRWLPASRPPRSAHVLAPETPPQEETPPIATS
jgi:hypothetical protein